MRVLITRAQPQADATASRVETLGYRAVVAPLTEVVSLNSGVEQLRALPKDPECIMVATSGRAVQTLLDAGLKALLVETQWAVVGQSAADLLARSGARLFAEPVLDVRALIAVLPTGKAMTYVCAHDRNPLLENSVHFSSVVPVYRAKALGGFDARGAADLRANGLDAGLIYSPRGAKLLVEAFVEAGLSDLLPGSQWFCLSHDVSLAFSTRLQHSVNGPVPHLRVPDRPRQDALLSLMDQHLDAIGP